MKVRWNLGLKGGKDEGCENRWWEVKATEKGVGDCFVVALDMLREDHAVMVHKDVGEFPSGCVVDVFPVFGKVAAVEPACSRWVVSPGQEA